MNDFIDRLKSGPVFLFLGQEYLRLESAEDLLLSQIIKKYGSEHLVGTNYYAIFETKAGLLRDEAYSWMLARCLHLPIPKPIEVIAGFMWSGVFTSAFDDILQRAFRSEWREVQSIVDDGFRPIEPRNRSRLHIWHLFGALTAHEQAALPPLTQEDFWEHLAMATTLASQLPELVTPLGTLAIEGYSGKDDWFSPERLFPVVNKLIPGQAHIFSITDDLEQDRVIATLIKQGKLIPHRESIALCLLKASEAGQIRLGERPEDLEFGHQVRFANKKHNIPPALWHLVSSTAHILTESVFLPLPSRSADQLYTDFRHFLFEASYCPLWEGYTRGFAFNRDYEQPLKSKIYQQLRSTEFYKKVMVLFGQTGTGKTVTLGRLAYEIQKEGHFPVLFIERTTSRVKREAIDRYCEWAESEGAVCTLIVWDGMQYPREYLEMMRYLQSRGRKIVLLGSCYKFLPSEFKDVEPIESPTELSSDEIQRFSDFITKFDPDLNDYLQRRVSQLKGSFLVFLYRLLPPSRTAIRLGLEKELAFAETYLVSQTINKVLRPTVTTIMGQLLKDAGLLKEVPMITAEEREMASESVTELQELIGLVMVPGQFNLPCPFDLLMRSMGRGLSEEFVDILKSVDIFRWIEDLSGNILIGPRSSLEAELIVHQRIGGAFFEVDYAIKLLSAIRFDKLFEQQEVQFAVDLLQNIGPNGWRPEYYKPFFTKLADCLRNARLNSGLTHPRLMLQESMLYRESAKILDEIQEKFDLLKKSEEATHRALSLIEDRPKNRPFLSNLLVELATAYGQMAMIAKNPSDRLNFARRAHSLCQRANILNPQNFAAIDVVAWSANELLTDPSIGEQDRLSLEQEVYHTLNLADAEMFTGDDLEKLIHRKHQFFEKIGKKELSEEAFRRLLDLGSTSGIYLRCSQKIQFLYEEMDLDEIKRTKCKESYEYLLKFRDLVEKDSKCLFLMLRLWYAWKAGFQLNVGERVCLPFDFDDWSEFRRMVTMLLQNDDFVDNLKLKYFFGVICFHLRDFQRGFQIFGELDRESESYSRRIIKYHLWSDKYGHPLLFNGTVNWVHDYKKGRGEIFINEIQRRIAFMVHETSLPEVRKGFSLNNFKISFSMRGPLADFRN